MNAPHPLLHTQNRRTFLVRSGLGLGSMAAASLTAEGRVATAAVGGLPGLPHLLPTAIIPAASPSSWPGAAFAAA